MCVCVCVFMEGAEVWQQECAAVQGLFSYD